MSKERAFVQLIEQKILSGDLRVGEKISSERTLVDQYGYSRKTVHNGLIRLEEKGLINILERQGAFVKDFHAYGDMSILDTMLDFNKEAFSKDELKYIVDFARVNINQIIENCSTNTNFDDSEAIVKLINALVDTTEVKDRVHVIFDIYRLMAVDQGNFLLLLLVNSLKTGISNVSFYTATEDQYFSVLCKLLVRLYEIISKGEKDKAIECNNLIIDLLARNWMEGEEDE